MNLIGLPEGERNPIYQKVVAENIFRQYHFLHTLIETAVSTKKTLLTESLINDLNYHAIVLLHPEAGVYRSKRVSVGSFEPPHHSAVGALMSEFVGIINSEWESTDALRLAANALWRINHIHPFINGNGRTARAVCYFILCTKAGGPLPGQTLLPELIRRPTTRSRYVAALKAADAPGGDTSELTSLLHELVLEQLESAT